MEKQTKSERFIHSMIAMLLELLKNKKLLKELEDKGVDKIIGIKGKQIILNFVTKHGKST